MTLTSVIFILLGVAVGGYWQLYRQTDKVNEYTSRRDRRLSIIITEITETLGRALEPALHRLREHAKLLEVYEDLGMSPTDILKGVGVPEILREYEEEYSELFVECSEVKEICEKAIGSSRARRDWGLRGGLLLLMLGAAMFVLELFNIDVAPWPQLGGLLIVVFGGVMIYRMSARHHCLEDKFIDKCS